MTLEELTNAVLTISPQLVDSREATALVESCGVNDLIANSDYGVADTFALGQYILRSRKTLEPVTQRSDPETGMKLLKEARFAAHKFNVSFAYALPWTVLVAVEYLKPKLLQLTPEWGGILSLSLIASLISAGGFSQAIARTGYFYIGMREPNLALRLCLIFIKWGGFVCCSVAAAGFLAADYFDLFAPSYLLWGCVNYLVLSMLWMFCAMLSVQGRAWRIPLVFVIGGAAFILLHADFGVIFPMFAANAIALACAAAFSISGFHSLPGGRSSSTFSPALPRLPIVVYMLVPFFFYGIVYFAFLFADRIAAGTAISWASGLSFGIESQYKQGMDVALFIFLVLSAAVEYVVDNFMRYWFELAEQQTPAGTDRVTLLKIRYWWSLASVCALFVLLASPIWFACSRAEPGILVTAVLGSLGYFFVALALFNLIILFSVNHPAQALGLLSAALVCNFLTGYVLSHVFGVGFAVTGLLAGGLVLLVISGHVVKTVLGEADYFYALA